MAWLNYHHLYYFRIIAQEGSIAKASQKLRLGQPTLSTQLKQLEDALGQSLFDRKRRKLYLTEAGKTALKYAEEVFRLGDEMIEALRDRVGSSKPHVQIGALDGVPKGVILDLIFKLRQTGNCTISILEGKGEELFRELIAHRIDLILSNYSPSFIEEKGVVVQSIDKFNVMVYGAPQFQHLKENFPHSLNGQPIIFPTIHSKLRHDLDYYFKMHQIEVEVIAETQDASLQKLMGLAGLGLIPMAERAVQLEVQEKKLIPLGKLDAITEEIWMISASRRIENPITASLSKSFLLTQPVYE
jgi:LysR family transcriptional activator of nhaA